MGGGGGGFFWGGRGGGGGGGLTGFQYFFMIEAFLAATLNYFKDVIHLI